MTSTSRSSASQIPGEQISVRFRARDGMKPLSLQREAAFLFPAGDAYVDRIKASLDLTFRCRTREDFAAVADLWADQANASVSGDEAGSPLLDIEDGRGAPGTTLRLTIRKDDWLFSGIGTASFNHTQETVTVQLRLDLNPTRWLACQPRAAAQHLQHLSASESLRRREAGPVDTIRALDGMDNVVDWFERAGTTFERREERRAVLLDVYLGHVGALLRERLMPRAPDNPCGIAAAGIIEAATPLRLVLGSQAEIYWELSSRDPVTDVSEIRCAVQAAAPEARWAHSTKPLPVEAGIDRDAPWITLPLTREINLAIYAKAADRVRFEIRYNRRPPGRGTDIAERLQAACTDAERKMRRAWDGIRSMLTKRDETGDLLDFIDCLRRINVAGTERGLISILANNRSITEDAAPAAVIRALVHVGVLEHPVSMRNRRGNAIPRRYPLARRWSLMFDAALNRADCPPSRAT